MTIPKTQNVVADDKKVPVDTGTVVVTVEREAAPLKSAPKTVIVPARERKARGVKVIVVTLLLLGLVCASLGVYYAYKSKLFTHKKSHRGVCTLPVQSSSSSANLTLKEEVDVDADGNLETIKVPKFDNNDEATFYHDFVQEISVIKDDSDKICYIMPLDTARIPRPQSLIDVMIGHYRGLYLLDANRIRSNYEVVYPELSNSDVIDLYGAVVGEKCEKYQSYKLEEITGVTTTTTMSTRRIYRKFIMYPGGEMLFQFAIYSN